MLRLLSRSRFIISLRFSGLLMYFVIMVKLCRSRSNSPSNYIISEQETERNIHLNINVLIDRQLQIHQSDRITA